MSDSEKKSSKSPDESPSFTKKQTFFRRLFSTLGLWGFVGAAFWFNNAWLWVFLFGAVSVGGLIEYFQLFPGRGFKRFRWHCCFLALVYVGGLFAEGLGFKPPWKIADLDGFVVAMLIIGVVLARLRRPLEGLRTLEEIAVSVFGFFYIVLLFGFSAKILLLPLDENEGSSHFYLLYLLAVTKFTDMGAYSIGSLIGRDKMVPHVSPGKTWQGFGGAIFAAFVASFGCLWLIGDKIPLITPLHAALLSVALALVAVLGDLAESILKRSLQAKDSGHLIPGIGGILDLIDSILFTAPILYFYLQLLSR